MKNLELYYLGIHRDNVLFDEGIENETRHTADDRLWKIGNGLVYNMDAGYQFGIF